MDCLYFQDNYYYNNIVNIAQFVKIDKKKNNMLVVLRIEITN